MNDRYLTSLFKSHNLSKRQQYCVAVASLYALRLRDKASSLVEQAIGRDKIPSLLFSELFVHLSLFLGFPTMLEGLEHLVSKNGLKKKPSARKTKASLEKGRRVFRRIYGEHTDKVLSTLNDLHQEMVEWVLKDAYGKIFTRSGMTLSERELVNVVVLGIQGFTPQFFSHVRGALRVGVPGKGLVDVLNFISPFSRVNERATLRMLNQFRNVRSQRSRH